MPERYANNAESTLDTTIDSDDTTVVVASASTFPTAGNFRIRIDDELMLVTSVSGANFTVTRGIEGTTGASHTSGVAVRHVLTALAIPGRELDFVQATTAVNVTASTEGSAVTLITGTSVTYDGNTRIQVDFVCNRVLVLAVANASLVFVLVEDSTVLGQICSYRNNAAVIFAVPAIGRHYLTPSAGSHTYYIKAHNSTTGTSTANFGNGGAGTGLPGFMRITVA